MRSNSFFVKRVNSEFKQLLLLGRKRPAVKNSRHLRSILGHGELFTKGFYFRSNPLKKFILSNFLSKVLDIGNPFLFFLRKFEFLYVVYHRKNPAGNFLHLGLSHSPGGYPRGSQANPRRIKRRGGVVGY